MKKIILFGIALIYSTTFYSQSVACFSSPAINFPMGSGGSRGIASGDLNNDGHRDIVATNFSNNSVTITLGMGDGRIASGFTYPLASNTNPRSIAIADMNNDSKNDIVVACTNTNTIYVIFGNGTGGVASSSIFSMGPGCTSVALGDLNGDGNQDIVTANSSGNNVSIRLGDGLGGFPTMSSMPAGSGTYFVALAKMNNDNFLDIVTANTGNTVSVLIGNGDGTFQSALSYSSSGTPYSLTVGDFNLDGNNDVAVTANAGNYFNVLLGSTTGALGLSTQFGGTGTAPFGITCGYYDDDTILDIAVSGNTGNTVKIFSGNGLGAFAVVNGPYSFSVALGLITTDDFNGDGFDDLAVANYTGGGFYTMLNHRAKITAVSAPALCPGDSVMLIANNGYNFNYSWAPIGGANDTIVVHAADTIVLTISNTLSSCSKTDTQIVIQNIPPNVYAIASANPICVGSQVTLTGANAQTYTWSGSVIDGVPFTPLLPATYTVIGTAANGCSDTASIHIGFTIAPMQEICTLTVDSATGNHNVIVWEKASNVANIDSFLIFREITLNNYQQIGSVFRDSLSEFHDYGANPNSTGYRYKIKTLDTCGNVSAYGLWHNSIHLAYFGTGNFNWNHYLIEPSTQPALSYNFYRDSVSNGTWSLLQVVSGSQTAFTDVNYSLYPNARYRVEVGWATSCSPSRAAINTSRSNIKNTSSVNGIKANEIIQGVSVYPNPFNNNVTFELSLDKNISYTLEVTNTLGQVITSTQLNSSKTIVNTSDWAAGVYFYKLYNKNSVKAGKITKE